MLLMFKKQEDWELAIRFKDMEVTGTFDKSGFSRICLIRAKIWLEGFKRGIR
jgi:hypothetical protein